MAKKKSKLGGMQLAWVRQKIVGAMIITAAIVLTNFLVVLSEYSIVVKVALLFCALITVGAGFAIFFEETKIK